MKLAVVCLLALGVAVYVSARPEDRYTNKYDNIDVDQILRNDRLLNRYVDCILEKRTAKCPPEAIELKNVMAEALDTECEKCSEYQKDMIKKVIKYLVRNKPQMWSDLKAKYDADGKYAKKYEDMAKEEGVEL